MSASIQHVSDTALLVAAARAIETDLEDGLVRDVYAKRLAGERGMAIARSGSPSRWRSFGIGLRSRFIDEFLLAEINEGHVDCVVCLGAGLDARPWRLPLPHGLQWIEVDFAPILDYKHNVLQDLATNCHTERVIADLNNETDRRRVIDITRERSNKGRALLLTEGLLFYLPETTVRSIATGIAAACSRWISDISPQTSFLKALGGDSMRQAMEFRHETRLEGAEIVQTILDSGWETAASRTFVKDAIPFAVERMRKNGWTPDPNTPRASSDDPGGVWLFKRTH